MGVHTICQVVPLSLPLVQRDRGREGEREREREREREGEREREQKKRERKQEEKKDSVEGHLYVFGLNPKPHQTRSVWTGLNQSQVAGSSVGRSLELWLSCMEKVAVRREHRPWLMPECVRVRVIDRGAIRFGSGRGEWRALNGTRRPLLVAFCPKTGDELDLANIVGWPRPWPWGRTSPAKNKTHKQKTNKVRSNL